MRELALNGAQNFKFPGFWYATLIGGILWTFQDKTQVGFPFAKLLRNFAKEAQSFSFVALQFCATKTFCAIIGKLHFAQNCAIPLLRYSVFRNFAEQMFINRLIKGVTLYKLGISMRLKFNIIAMLKRELITCLKLSFATWCMMAHCHTKIEQYFANYFFKIEVRN